MIAVLFSQGLFALGRWAQGREATGKDIERLEAKLKAHDAEREHDRNRYHRKLGDIQRLLGEMEDGFVSKEAFGQFARRYEALEARYNNTHNGNHS